MSATLDIDELVAALSSNHIGQHQLDIAKVRDQLAQLLYYQSGGAQQHYPTSPVQHTTPTTRTTMPSWLPETRQRSASLASVASLSGRMSEPSIAEELEVEMQLDLVESPAPTPAPAHAPSPPPQSPGAYALVDPFYSQTLAMDATPAPSFFATHHAHTHSPFFAQVDPNAALPRGAPYFVQADAARPALSVDTSAHTHAHRLQEHMGRSVGVGVGASGEYA